jgi:putative oxidoreductase
MKLVPNLTRFGDVGLIALRFSIGIIFLVHGTYKWRMWEMVPSEHLSATMLTIFKILSIAEPLGAVAIIVGFLTPYAAIGLSIVMIGTINMKINVMHLSFMARGATGWEFDTMILAGLICLLFIGPGKFSVDKKLFKE